MQYRSTNTLAGKIFIASSLIILTTLVLTGTLGYWQAQRALESEVHSHVNGVLGERRSRVEDWIDERKRDLISFSGTDEITQEIASHLFSSGVGGDSHIDLLVERLATLRTSYPAYEYAGLFDPVGTLIAETGARGRPNDISNLSMFRIALGGEFDLGSIFVSPEGVPVAYLSYPVYGHQGDVLAVLIVLMNTTISLDPILLDTVGLGMNGEIFLVGADTVMLTPSRFHYHPEPLMHKMPIPAVLAALSGDSGVMEYRGFLGNNVVGAYAFMPDQRWVMIVEMVTTEAYAPLKIIARNSVVSAAGALILILIVAVALSRTWTRPIERLAEASLRVAEGDLTVTVPDYERSDEIGTLANQFNRMVGALNRSGVELRNSHDKLLQSEKLAVIGQLATGIVHEMRNPLSVIKMNLRLLQRKAESEPESDPIRSEQVELALLQSDRLEKMLSELLDYSKPVSLDLKKVTADNIVKNSIIQTQLIADEAGVSVVPKLESNVKNSVIVDEDIFTRLIVNLLSNAIQASSSGGLVKLKSETLNDGSTVFIVRDKGSGMSSRVIERLFDPFYTTRGEGIGLGMSNVRKFADAHGASIDIESEENIGTVITVSLPKEEHHA